MTFQLRTSTEDLKLRSWRWRVFAATWLCYAGMYFCRKPFYITKASLESSLSFNATMLGSIGAAYLLAYTAGQFISGIFGTMIGPRIVLLVGMGVAIGSNIVFGITDSYELFLVFMVLNGLAQATGWSCTVGTMANWFRRSERGTVMGVWATNFQAGGVMANALAAWALGSFGFRYSFFMGSAVLMTIWLFFFFNQRNKPEDVGLPAQDDEAYKAAIGEEVEENSNKFGLSRSAVINVLLIGSFYFFLKFIRYALWSWAPYFLVKNFSLAGDSAGYLSTLFDFFGIGGVIVIGILSDKLFKSRRAGISLIMILAMSASCLLLFTAGKTSITVFAACLSLVGFTLYGPDALLSGAGAMDIGTKRGAALAAGIINGMGSIGAVVQEFAIGRTYDASGGQLGPVFAILFGASGLATLMVGIVALRNRLGRSDV